MPNDCYNSWALTQHLENEVQAEQEQIDPQEWDEFCDEVMICYPREFEDQSWLYGRKDV